MSAFEMGGNEGQTETPHCGSMGSPAQHTEVTVIASSIDETLSQLGDESKRALLFHIRALFHLQQDDFTRDPGAFGKALARILGRGANTLEGAMVQQMESSAADQHEVEGFALRMMASTRLELSTQAS